MSYNRQQQQQPDSHNNSSSSVAGGGGGSSSGRYRGSGSGRDWEAGYRDRSTGRQSYVPEGGVARDRMRSGSVDRGQRSPIPSQPAGSEGRSGHSRSQLGRWAGHDIWYRDEHDRDRERSSWDGRGRRERDHAGGVNAPTSARYNRDGHQQVPPPAFTSRHSVASFGRDRIYTPAPAPPSSFSRRATEPGEMLEEGELEIDDRVNAHSLGLGGRTYTVPAGTDAGSISKRADTQSLGFRSESRRPSSAISTLHGLHHQHSAQPRPTDRKFSQPQTIVRPPSRPLSGSRNGTPSPKRLSPTGKDSPRTPTPEPVRAPSVSACGFSSEPAAKREPSLSLKAEVPALEAQSRISDIDREIAECQERLVMIATTPVYSGPAPVVVAAAGTAVVSKVKLSTPSDTINDRTVPTSPPAKRSTSAKADGMAAAEGAVLSHESRRRAADKSGTDTLVPQVGAPKQIRQQQAPEQTPCADVGSDFDDEALLVAGALSSDENDEDGDDAMAGAGKESLKDKRRARAAVRTIYAENQARAATVQAALAAPFLAAFPRFVPGAYPEPSDWPFWAENERKHARTRPYLAAILAREKSSESEHARHLQEEYAELYARWRKRVDRLDRQREARQRALSTASGTASAGGVGGSGGGGSVGGGGRRRTAGAVVSTIATADEFGFSLGPLFSASPAVVDVGGRGEDGAFTSDAVHSEAELQAIIERLQHDDARSPDARSQRTAATIPNMVVGARDRALLRFANSSHLVEDPLAFYHAQLPAPGTGAHRRATFGNNGDGDHEWTQAEVSAFVAAYLTHPKEFGVIAACIPHKSMNACVQFYYRNKKQLRLKALEAKANRRARRAVPAARRRKDRARDRRDRRAREERERIAAEAAASLAAPETHASDDDDDDVAGTTALAEPQPPLPVERAGALERHSRGSALLRSIVQASRRRKLDEAQALAAPALLPGPAEDSEASDDAGRAAPSPCVVSDSACMEIIENPRDVLLAASAPPPPLPPVDEEEDGELVEDTRWEPRRRSRQQSELNAYAMGGSIVRTRRSRGDSDQSLSDASDDSQSRISPAPSAGDANGGADIDVYADGEADGDGEIDASMDAEEVVEVSGVVADRSRVRPFPRIVSRKSQSRFDVTLTAILDTAIEATQSELKQRSGSPPTESALDRFVTEELSAHRRPISSYETLLICSSATTNSPTRGSSSLSLSIDAALPRQPTQPMSAPLQTPLDIQVDTEAGPNESVLVGAAVWLRDDRRRVLRALHRLGADFAQVASLMPSKTMAQCRYFYYHYRTPAGALISEIIPNALTAFNASAAAAANTAPAIGSLVLPPLSARTKPGVPSSMTSPDPTLVAATSKTGAGSDASHDDDADADNDSEDDDDETPLAAQLASSLAAAALATPGSTHPPSSGASGQPRHMLARASTIAQVPLDALAPRMTPISSLVLPPKQLHASESPRASPPLSARSNTVGVGSVAPAAKSALATGGSVGRSPSSPPPMTAKKSGYSSYWSVHEKSAFAHYVVRLGQDWQALADAIGSKTGTQVRNFFRASRERLNLDDVMSEFERNRAAGTLPPMTPFQPAPSLLPASPATAHTPSDDSALRKEKRGRKRKNDISRSSAEPSHSDITATAAKRPAGAAQGQQSQALAPMPNTAPASMANFPTIGVDGGRAVVFARPVPPPPPMARPPQSWAPPRPVVGTAAAHYHQPYLQHSQHAQPSALPPLHAREYGNDPADRLLGVTGRAESGTPSTQPTPPPLEGLPRFSSSPAPAQLLAQPPSRHYPSMHISSLTSGSSATRGAHHYSPPPPLPLHLPPSTQQYRHQAAVDVGETRKVSVTKINALLNDDSPPTTQAELTANWFGGDEEEEEETKGDVGNDDDATGIAALALASMMGAGRSPQPPPSSLASQPVPVVHPRPQTLAERQHPAIMRHHRPSDPLPPFGSGHMHMPTMSAFSPVALRGSPMPPMSPSLSASHMHSRPSSVGPSSSYRHQSPGIQRSLAMSPPRGTPISVNTRQRKPSAPPIPVPAAYAGRASISGYPHHQYAEQRVTQLPPPSARRLPYPMGSSPQMSATRPGVAPPYPPTVESSFGPRYADAHHYQPQQQQQRYNTPPLASGHPPPPPQPTYHYPQPSPMSPVNMHLPPPPPPPGMRQYPLPGTGAVPNGSSRGYSAGPPPSQQQPPPPYHHHGPPQH